MFEQNHHKGSAVGSSIPGSTSFPSNNNNTDIKKIHVHFFHLRAGLLLVAAAGVVSGWAMAKESKSRRSWQTEADGRQIY